MTSSQTTSSDGTTPEIDISLEAAKRKLDEGAVLLDVRNDDEWKAGHAPGALFVPLPRLESDRAGAVKEIAEASDDREIVVICRSGARSRKAAEILRQEGHLAYNIVGGMKAWAAAFLPMESETGSEPKVI
jgi:rhodanese-related sulfurtransferase